MNLIIFGPPGSGKGTAASRLEPILKIVKISTGDIFREAIKENTDLGKKVKSYLDKGELVPDDVTIEVLKERINKPDAKNGFILDGFPRTIPQAESLSKITKIDAIINLIVPEDVIIERLSNRLICKKCEEIYNRKYMQPKKPDICDKCGGELYQRDDDKPEVIKERFRVYQNQTAPLLDYYKNKVPFANVKSERAEIPPEENVRKILEELKKLNLAQ